MLSNQPTALIADDEPLLRSALARMLAATWPELTIVAQARNGREALEQYQLHKPTVCFLDIHMPGLDGHAVAQALASAPACTAPMAPAILCRRSAAALPEPVSRALASRCRSSCMVLRNSGRIRSET